MDTSKWQEEVRDWMKRRRASSEELAADAVSFFKFAFNHTRCPNKAWFGIHSQTASLVVGGIFLAALVRSGNDKGLWLLVDQDPPIVDGIEYRPVKSTTNSESPLFWAHSSSFASVRNLIAEPTIWD